MIDYFKAMTQKKETEWSLPSLIVLSCGPVGGGSIKHKNTRYTKLMCKYCRIKQVPDII